MISSNELREIENLIRDLRIAQDFKNSMDKDEPFMVLPLAEPVSITFDQSKKNEVNNKISVIEKDLKKRLSELIK